MVEGRKESALTVGAPGGQAGVKKRQGRAVKALDILVECGRHSQCLRTPGRCCSGAGAGGYPTRSNL